jgi:chemotaxis protein methyltransferase CheR
MLTETETRIDDKQFRRLCAIVHQHCGITLHDGKQDLVRARVARQLRSKPFANANDYLETVMNDPAGEEFASLIDALSTNLTSFFRESSHFTYLSQELLPKVMARQRQRRLSHIRAWSAACSTGEEPYTIAITLCEALEGKGHWDAKILATDISRNVLRTAVNGTYDAPRVDGVPQSLRAKYFAAPPGAADRLRVAAAARSMVTFNYLNLMDPWPFSGPFDFIFCRNVMIYFDKPTQEKLVNRFWNCLASDGVLFTGHSESLTGIAHKFEYVRPTIYLKP